MKTVSLFILFLLVFSGCDTFLDTVPDNRTELDTADKISQLITSAYPKSNYALVANAMVDGMVPAKGLSPRAGYSYYDINEDAYYWRDPRSTSTGSPDDFWTSCYTAIATANHALAEIERQGNPKELSSQRSEALLCRAFAHFLLVNLFAKTYEPGGANDAPGIPYADKPETVVLANYTRQSVAEVYARIEDDLETALQNPPLEATFKVPAYHFTAKAAHVFASRFYLYKGEYQKVIEHTTQVVPTPTRAPGGNVALTDAANVWATGNFASYKTWGTVSDEIRQAFRAAEGKHNFLLTETYSNLNRSWTCQYVTPSSSIPSGVNITGGYWPFRSVYNTSYSDAYFQVKFSEYFFYTTTDSGLPMIMFPFIRAEEALLNRIEAEIHLDMFDAAINDLNVYYRQRAGATTTVSSAYNETTMVLSQTKINNYYRTAVADTYLKTYNAFGAASWNDDKIALMLTLLDTRKAEYIHEGYRWFDILRYKIPVNHLDRDNQLHTLLPDDLRRVWQIPETAIGFGLEPNPR
ncbi:MAG: RagB/SusD family nutrient uptake outer membrane protein [Prevotellaceae bacterium]|nr:RagB/SusD family nutrient uptake outer membrane protein [Prevotellaceae bacterium]